MLRLWDTPIADTREPERGKLGDACLQTSQPVDPNEPDHVVIHRRQTPVRRTEPLGFIRLRLTPIFPGPASLLRRALAQLRVLLYG
jgi:hypothetical protein